MVWGRGKRRGREGEGGGEVKGGRGEGGRGEGGRGERGRGEEGRGVTGERGALCHARLWNSKFGSTVT